VEDDMIALDNILIATDFEAAGDAALTYGRALARAFGATLHVLHVTGDVTIAAASAEFYGTPDLDLQTEIDEAARHRLGALVASDDAAECPIKIVVRSSHAPAEVIAEYARAHDTDLIVMGTHGRNGLGRLFLGSIAAHVVRTAPCPVLTVRHPEHEFIVPDALTATEDAA
jgi:nucleotide-binding universal stress UspA family protein